MKEQEIYVKINKIMKKIKREINDYEKWEWTNIGFHDEFQGNNIKEISKLSRELKSLYNKLLKGESEGDYFMEIKINKEIRDYTENIYFGLNLRQFICALLGIAVSVGLYFILRGHLGKETLSWVCMLGAFPFVAIGFLKYNGMPAEKVAMAFIKSKILMPYHLTFKPTNFYYELIKTKKEEKNSENTKKKRKGKD